MDFHAGEARGDALLHAAIGNVVEHGLRGFHFLASGARHAGDGAAVAAERLLAVLKAAGDRELPHGAAGRALGSGQFDELGEKHGPGDDGGEGKADHHALDDDIGRHEHAPGGKVVRQAGLPFAAVIDDVEIGRLFAGGLLVCIGRHGGRVHGVACHGPRCRVRGRRRGGAARRRAAG